MKPKIPAKLSTTAHKIRRFFRGPECHASRLTQQNTAARVASHLAGPILEDMRNCHRLYGFPSQSWIDDYETELLFLLRHRYLNTYEFGFERKNNRALSWHYEFDYSRAAAAKPIGPRRIRAISLRDCQFFNYVTYTPSWSKLSAEEKKRIRAKLPVKRVNNPPPSDGKGFWKDQQSFSSKGAAFNKRSFIPLRSD